MTWSDSHGCDFTDSPAGEDGVAGRDSFARQGFRHRCTVALGPGETGGLGPEPATLERVGRRSSGVELPWAIAAKSGPVATDVGAASASAIWRRSPTPLRIDNTALGAARCSGQTCTAALVNTGCGPISISTEQPRAATVRTLSANCTGWRE